MAGMIPHMTSLDYAVLSMISYISSNESEYEVSPWGIKPQQGHGLNIIFISRDTDVGASGCFSLRGCLDYATPTCTYLHWIILACVCTHI